jgi:DNA repair exonuclease SbcCD nuclease subunit
MKLVVFSDLHLDAAFAWAGAGSQAAQARRQALRSTLRRTLDLAWAERADAVLCAGDLYEHDRYTPDTASFLRACFDKVYPLRIFISPGNHDYYGPDSIYTTVGGWSPNVRVFSETSLEPVTLDHGLTLWGAAHKTPAGTPGFLSGFKVDRGGVNIALFHGSELGGLPAQGADKSPHAPFREDEIEKSGLNHAFVGHYHCPRDGRLHTYPGNPDPLSFGETGARGAVIATIGDDGSIQRSRRSVASTQLHEIAVDVTGCSTREEIRELVESRIAKLRGAARVTIQGELAREVDLGESDLVGIGTSLDAYALQFGKLEAAHNLGALAGEPTVRGRFVKDVMESDLGEDERRRVLTVGLRALEGRKDLGVS